MAEGRALAATLAGAVGCAGIAWAVIAAEEGCQLQGVCDPSSVSIVGFDAGSQYGTTQGFQRGAGVYGGAWESSHIDGTWMDFPGERTYFIYPQLPDGAPFVGPYAPGAVYISPDPSPYTTPGSNLAPSAGNITELSGLPDGGTNGFEITNATCTRYYLWLRMTQEYPPDAVVETPQDASSEAGAD